MFLKEYVVLCIPYYMDKPKFEKDLKMFYFLHSMRGGNGQSEAAR